LLEVLVRMGNVAERGPLVTVGGPLPTFRKRFRNESILKPGNHRKITIQKLLNNAKNINLLKRKEH